MQLIAVRLTFSNLKFNGATRRSACVATARRGNVRLRAAAAPSTAACQVIKSPSLCSAFNLVQSPQPFLVGVYFHKWCEINISCRMRPAEMPHILVDVNWKKQLRGLQLSMFKLT